MSRTDGAAPAVTVLMPVHDGERFLREQVESILAQRGVDLRLVVLDDGSIDGSAALLAAMVEADARILLLDRRPRAGLTCAVSRLLEHVDAPFFAMADQDDVWDPDKLAASIAHLEATGASLVYSDVRLCDEGGRVTARSYLSSRRMRVIEGRDPVPFVFRNPTVGHTLVGRAAVASLARPVPSALEFYEAWLVGAACEVGRVAFVPRALGSYRIHATNVIGPRRRLRQRLASAWRRDGRLVRRQRTRAAGLAALARRRPHLDGIVAAYDASGVARLAALPRLTAFLLGYVRTIGVSGVLSELGAYLLAPAAGQAEAGGPHR